MEITIGIKHLSRELTIHSNMSAEELQAAVSDALSVSTGILSVTDEHGRVTIVPAGAIGFVHIGPEGPRRVGFGAV
ncbi:MAG: DUF3107 domain-containing protein [Bifidobacteriaceae bacterium]|nr:DUF3107 domain-containing protein [Bifidobacteriaceae bacterium]